MNYSDDGETLIPLGELMQAARLGVLKIEQNESRFVESQGMQAVIAAEIAINRTSKIFAIIEAELKEVLKKSKEIQTIREELGFDDLTPTIEKKIREISALKNDHEKMHQQFFKATQTKARTR